MKNFHIVGIHKAGTMALKDYFRAHGFGVIGHGSLFRDPGGLIKHREKYMDAQVIFILRDPIERMYSYYTYASKPNKDNWEVKADSFQEALEKYPEIVESSDYYRWIIRWKEFNPAVVHLEEMIRIKDFPKSNYQKFKTKMTVEERLFAMKKLRDLQSKPILL